MKQSHCSIVPKITARLVPEITAVHFPKITALYVPVYTMHHKLFDLGAFTLKNNIIYVSDRVNGTGASEWLLRFHGKEIKLPQREKYYPKPEFTEWHVNEVFKGMEREA